MIELRILSGLHRGATLPLTEDVYVIGASDDDDVVLVDPGVNERHASLTRTASGWLLSAEDGSLFGADSNRPESAVDLMPGEFARLGKVWVTVAAEDAEWQEPPEAPTEIYSEPVAAESADTPEDIISIADLSAPLAEESDTEDTGQEVASVVSRTTRRVKFFAPIGVAAVLFAAAAYAMTKPASSAAKKNMASLASSSSAETSFKPDTRTASANGGQDEPATPEKLRKVFKKRLADADLLKHFELTLDDRYWSMRADLDDDETVRFERILKSFIDEYQVAFPISAKVVGPEGMLPFKIRQVISGSNGGVVTEEGVRLYIGDEYRGVRMVSVQGNRLTFAGQRKIEMNW